MPENKPLSPLPWKISESSMLPGGTAVVDANGKPVASSKEFVMDDLEGLSRLDPVNAEYIVKAVNAHEALVAALRGLEYRGEPGTFCDHAAEPCPRCEAARKALALVEKPEGV